MTSRTLTKWVAGGLTAALLLGIVGFAGGRGSGAREQSQGPAEPEAPPRSPSISGRVVDHEGRPVAGATVGTSQSMDAVTHSDAAGAFTLGVPRPEAMAAFAYASGTATERVSDVKPGTTDLRLVLRPEARVTGTVTLASGSALVSLCETQGERLCVSRALVRDGQDRFDLRGLSAGSFELRVDREGERIATQPVELRAGETAVLGVVVGE